EDFSRCIRRVHNRFGGRCSVALSSSSVLSGQSRVRSEVFGTRDLAVALQFTGALGIALRLTEDPDADWDGDDPHERQRQNDWYEPVGGGAVNQGAPNAFEDVGGR